MPGSESTLPTGFADENALDDFLARPQPDLVASLGAGKGDLVLLGVAGKMGISMAMLAVRALKQAGSKAKVIGVSRFSEKGSRERLEQAGVTTVPCDLLNPTAVDKLPDSKRVVFLAGKKFGTSGDSSATWAMNAVAPAYVARRYADANIVAMSTGCVYPLAEPASGGCDENVTPVPIGEYAMSALARERVFEYASRSAGTKVCIVRLNYSLDLRYGVIHDVVRQILDDAPVDISVPCFNGIWQGDANRMILRCLELCASPSAFVNLTGPETLTVERVAINAGQYLGKKAKFSGTLAPRMYLNDGGRLLERFGYPTVTPATVVRWTADWLAAGRKSLGKPTHFQTTDGKY
ncbi:MAG: NAD(P)-dependent oxidoreductase [Planctomycetota bacterium]